MDRRLARLIMSFVHLHTWSWYSFLRGGSSPASLVAEAVRLGQPALALTDWLGVAGAVQLAVAARKAGLEVVIGSEIPVEGAPLVLLAAGARGYEQLNQLLTRAYRQPLTLADLADDQDALFLLTGSHQGRLAQLVSQQQARQAQQWLQQLKGLMPGRVLVEVHHPLLPQSGRTSRWLLQLARETCTPAVATNAVTQATPPEFARHDLLNRIRLKLGLTDFHPELSANDQGYLKSLDEMQHLIPDRAALANTVSLAKECQINLLPGQITPPGAQLPHDFSDPNQYLRHLCYQALEGKYPQNTLWLRAARQLEHELKVITAVGVEEFFLVVHEVVHWARQRGIRCAGRGSAGNSLVAYLLNITAVCPLQHGLLFERFLHQGRRGTPDIDVDFDAARRSEVIDWMFQRFSSSHTAMTANVQTYGLRGALQEVAKVWGMGSRLTRGIPPHASPAQVAEHHELLTAALHPLPLPEGFPGAVALLEGCPRHLSLHSGGMILAHTSLQRFTPIQTSANGVERAVFNKDDIEYLGLVKLDVLGLRALAMLSRAVALIEQTTGQKTALDQLDLADPQVYRLICSGQTIGLFQVESPGQRNLLARTQPRNFAQLVVQIALLRPGPIEGGAIPPYLRRLRGQEAATPPHPSLARVLHDTLGLILFQEQVLEVCYVFAGLSLQEADEFRRLMSKARDPQQMEQMRQQFVAGAQQTHPGLETATAHQVFDQVAKFVGYGFPRSHAVAFAHTVYQTAWLKTYHPAAFLAATMQHWPGMYPQQAFIEEARRLGIQVEPPEIHQSQAGYTLEDSTTIRQPLGSLREVGPADEQAILIERLNGGFEHLEGFYRRIPLDRNVLESLARGGALDHLPLLPGQPVRPADRRAILWQLGLLARQLGPAGGGWRPLAEAPTLEPALLAQLAQLTPQETLNWDWQASGATTGPHPLALQRTELHQAGVIPIAQASHNPDQPDQPTAVAGLVITRQRPISARGVLFLTLQDETGDLQAVVSPEAWDNLGTALRSGAMVVQGPVYRVGQWKGLKVQQAWPLNLGSGTGIAGGAYQVLPRR